MTRNKWRCAHNPGLGEHSESSRTRRDKAIWDSLSPDINVTNGITVGINILFATNGIYRWYWCIVVCQSFACKLIIVIEGLFRLPFCVFVCTWFSRHCQFYYNLVFISTLHHDHFRALVYRRIREVGGLWPATIYKSGDPLIGRSRYVIAVRAHKSLTRIFLVHFRGHTTSSG